MNDISFTLTAPDVGHFACRDLAPDGACAVNAGAMPDSGVGMKWAVRAVDAMATASRKRDQGRCESWRAEDDRA